MKKTSIFSLACILLMFCSFTQEAPVNDPFEELTGTWKLDLTPGDLTDDNFTEMTLKEISPLGLKGEFYGSKMRKGNVNIDYQGIYFAFVTHDGSGDYNTAAMYKNGKLSGSTHSLGRDFLSVWTAVKVEK